MGQVLEMPVIICNPVVSCIDIFWKYQFPEKKKRNSSNWNFLGFEEHYVIRLVLVQDIVWYFFPTNELLLPEAVMAKLEIAWMCFQLVMGLISDPH